MTYEEKLQKVVNKLKDERRLTRKGRKTKVTFDDTSFTRVRLREVCKILLQLQDDAHIVKIIEALQPTETVSIEQITHPSDDDDYESVEEITVELEEKFDEWYKTYVLYQRSLPENLDWINLLKVYDVCININQQLQIERGTVVLIPSLPYPNLGRFPDLFPFDSIGTRKVYQQHRWEGVQYLNKHGVVESIKPHMEDALGYGNIEMKVNLLKFEEYYDRVNAEYTRRRQADSQPVSHEAEASELARVRDSTGPWPDDFGWEGNAYVFGKYGSVPFVSGDRKHIVKVLTDNKGRWATINELKGAKDATYVRSTIKQIEDRLPENAKGHVSIVSTQEDDTADKPSAGAYRIKIKP